MWPLQHCPTTTIMVTTTTTTTTTATATTTTTTTPTGTRLARPALRQAPRLPRLAHLPAVCLARREDQRVLARLAALQETQIRRLTGTVAHRTTTASRLNKRRRQLLRLRLRLHLRLPFVVGPRRTPIQRTLLHRPVPRRTLVRLQVRGARAIVCPPRWRCGSVNVRVDMREIVDWEGPQNKTPQVAVEVVIAGAANVDVGCYGVLAFGAGNSSTANAHTIDEKILEVAVISRHYLVPGPRVKCAALR